ncbi:hypothetical protein K2X89_08555 [Myxococcota bacterium]|nr:hypothetical protein [Myxococcota bacterium]
MMQIDSSSGFGPGEGARPESGPAPRSGLGATGRRLLAVGLAACLLASPSVVFAGDHTKEVSKESGMGAAAALTSLVYSPVKLVYAVGGLVIGSLAWVFTAGDTDVADKVYVRSLRGTYVITPEILRGEEPLVFIGRDPSVMPVEQPKAVASGPVADAPVADAYSDDAYGDSGW